MAFKTVSTQATALANVQAIAARAKRQMTQYRNMSASANITLTDAKLFRKVIDGVIADWALYAATPGLAQYAKDQLNDPAYDIVAEYNAMRSAAVALRDWLDANIPAEPTYTPAQTAGFRTAADTFLSTIE